MVVKNRKSTILGFLQVREIILSGVIACPRFKERGAEKEDPVVVVYCCVRSPMRLLSVVLG
jgi:hypothetical protein